MNYENVGITHLCTFIGSKTKKPSKHRRFFILHHPIITGQQRPEY